MIHTLATIAEVEETVETYVGEGNWSTTLRITVLVLIALPLCFILSKTLGKILRKQAGDHIGLLIQKIFFFSGFIAIVVTILLELGFNLGALLGAAGIASVAIGFASQTSLSNIISGLFLYGEKPFGIGDVVQVGETLGTVLSIDLLSVKIRQFDNKFVRIPNETMVKAQVTTITKFPIRRVDVNVAVSYKADPDHVIETLKKAAAENAFSLDDPAAAVIFSSFGESSQNFMLGAWCERTQFLDLKNSIFRDVKKSFDAEGIAFALPHRVLVQQEPRFEGTPPASS